MKTYTELKTEHEKEIGDFPIAFAFSDYQFEKGLKTLGATKESIIGIGGGGFIRKSDKVAFVSLIEKHKVEETEAFESNTFMVDATRYELGNHEYCITYDPTDTMDALGLSLEDDRVKACFEIARKEYMDWQEANG